MKYSIATLTVLGLSWLAVPSVRAQDAPATEPKKEEAMFAMTTTAPADVATVPADAEKTASGLASKMLKKGSGETKPVAADNVTVHYCGWTLDGKKFDSSLDRNEPTSFPLSGVIKGWTEGLQLMTEGEIRRFWIPADLAYGENPGGGSPGGMLVFDVELISIKAAPKTPADVAAAPADANKTASGLASKLLAEGKGESFPKLKSVVTVHYSGWTTDGKLFDSSLERGYASHLCTQSRHPWMARRRAIDEGRRKTPLLDSCRTCVWREPTSRRSKRNACFRCRVTLVQIMFFATVMESVDIADLKSVAE